MTNRSIKEYIHSNIKGLARRPDVVVPKIPAGAVPGYVVHADHFEELINEQVAAAFLSVSARTLQDWRVTGVGPRFIRGSSRLVRYRRKDLVEWANARAVKHTSEAV